MCKIAIAFLLLNFLYLETIAQSEIDFYPGMLNRELNRIYGDQNELKELATSDMATSQSLTGRFYAVSPKAYSSPTKYLFIGRVKTCRAGGCTINQGESNATGSEYFDYFIMYDTTCMVQMVRIYNYQATHGQEVSAKSWLKQFIGYNGASELAAGKNIDAISGATISVNAITLDIEYRTRLLKQTLKQ
jgi:hypothetical protein